MILTISRFIASSVVASLLSARNDMRLFNHKISVPSQSDVVVMMLMYPGCMAIGIIQDQKQEHNLEWPYVALRTAIPTQSSILFNCFLCL